MLTFNAALSEGFTYIIESQRGQKDPFSVVIKPISSVKLMTLEDGLLKRSADNSVSISSGSYNASLCKNALTGWNNMVDGAGKAIAMKTTAAGFISDDSLDQLPSSIITEIANVIAAVSQDPANIQIFSEAN
jgi:hypothetical protein